MGNKQSEHELFDIDEIETLEQSHEENRHPDYFTLDDLKRCMKTMNMQVMEEDIEEYFDRADTDGYGTLHEDEFRALLVMLRHFKIEATSAVAEESNDQLASVAGIEKTTAVAKKSRNKPLPIDIIKANTAVARDSHNEPLSTNEMEATTAVAKKSRNIAGIDETPAFAKEFHNQSPSIDEVEANAASIGDFEKASAVIEDEIEEIKKIKKIRDATSDVAQSSCVIPYLCS